MSLDRELVAKATQEAGRLLERSFAADEKPEARLRQCFIRALLDSGRVLAAARWIAKPWNEDAVAAAIETPIEPSRREPGCLQYLATRSLTDSRALLLWEEYVDEDTYRAHGESEHFARFGTGEGIPLLESREREFHASLTTSAARSEPER